MSSTMSTLSSLLKIGVWDIFSSLHIWGRNHHPLSENIDFDRTEHLLDLRPVCKLELVHCGPVVLYLSRFDRSDPTKFENTFFQIAYFRILVIFAYFHQNYRIFKKFSRVEFKSQGPEILESSPSYMYLSPCISKIFKIH